MDWTQPGNLDGKFVWLKESDRLFYLSPSKEKEEEEEKEKPPTEEDYAPKSHEIRRRKNYFAEFCDHVTPFHVRYFVRKFQRKITKKCEVITMNDIKDIVMFTFMNDIPKIFIEFFYTQAVDMFLRALLVYFQYFLRIWYIVGERHYLKHTHLAHPNSRVHELRWRQQLSDLRYILAREYCSILRGGYGTAKFHHSTLNATAHRDRILYELLYRFSHRFVEVGLNERGNQILIEEFNRLFRIGEKNINRKRKYLLDKRDLRIIEHPFFCPKLQFKSPLVRELYRPSRHPLFRTIGLIKQTEVLNEYFTGIQLGMLCREEHFTDANMLLGILGKVRAHYDPLLTFSEAAMKNEEDFMSVKVRHRSIFTRLTADRHEADAVIAKRSFCLPYKSKKEFYINHCFDARAERQKLKQIWVDNRAHIFRLKYEEAGEKHDEPPADEPAPVQELNLYAELDEMIKNNPYTDDMTLKLIKYIRSQMNIYLKSRRRKKKKLRFLLDPSLSSSSSASTNSS